MLLERFHILHLMKDALLALQHVATGLGRIETAGIGQRSGNEGTLLTGKLRGAGVEMPFGHRIGTIDAVAHLDGVEIDLHDALLRPEEFYQHREINLETFAQPRTARPKEDVLGRLLTDGGCP